MAEKMKKETRPLEIKDGYKKELRDLPVKDNGEEEFISETSGLTNPDGSIGTDENGKPIFYGDKTASQRLAQDLGMKRDGDGRVTINNKYLDEIKYRDYPRKDDKYALKKTITKRAVKRNRPEGKIEMISRKKAEGVMSDDERKSVSDETRKLAMQSFLNGKAFKDPTIKRK